MTLALYHAKDSSAILIDNGASVLEYSRKIHKYEAEADYATIKTELVTYGDAAAWEVFNYLKGVRQ